MTNTCKIPFNEYINNLPPFIPSNNGGSSNYDTGKIIIVSFIF